VVLLRACFLCASLFFLSFQAIADSLPIVYSLINLGAGEYQYDYSIYNNQTLGAGVPVQLFDLAFDPAFYSGLSIVTPNPLASQWTEQIFPAVGSSPADFDVSTPQNGGIAVGSTVSGFAVDFTWLGPGQPGSQAFQVYDPNSFAQLQSGNTITTVSFPNLQGGTASNPVALPVGSLIGSLGANGGQASQDYYSFLWAGGAFDVTASIGGGAGSSYGFSFGVIGNGGCSSLGSVTLNGADNFAGTVGNNGFLAAGHYCIGIDALTAGLNPTFGITFNTPIEGIGAAPSAPEPSTFALLFVGTGILISVARSRRAAVKG
jgi:hypothetical protein